MEQISALTTILQQFSHIFASGVKSITPFAKSIFFSLLTIDAVWTMINLMLTLEQSNIMAASFRRIIKYGIWLWLVNTYSVQINRILQSFLKVGIAAGGNAIDAKVLTDPSYIIEMGQAAFWPILSSAGFLSVLEIGSPRLLISFLAACASLFSYFVIALQLFTAYMEFYIIGALAVFFLPFAILEKTAFLAEKAIASIISISVKIMVTAFILSAVIPYLETVANADWLKGMKHETLLQYMFSMLALAYISVKIPSLAAGFFSGQASLSGGGVLGGAAIATTTMYSILRTGFQGIQKTLQAGSAVSSALRVGAETAAAGPMAEYGAGGASVGGISSFSSAGGSAAAATRSASSYAPSANDIDMNEVASRIKPPQG